MSLKPLNQYEIEANNKAIDTLFADAISNLVAKGTAPSDVQVRAARELIWNYAATNLITLSNLDKKEREDAALLAIITKALKLKAESQEILPELEAWKEKLKSAVAGKGQHVEMHAAQLEGMAEDLIYSGGVPAGKWGTDIDARHILAEDMTKPEEITQAGFYILPPVSLTLNLLEPNSTIVDEEISNLKTAGIGPKPSDTQLQALKALILDFTAKRNISLNDVVNRRNLNAVMFEVLSVANAEEKSRILEEWGKDLTKSPSELESLVLEARKSIKQNNISGMTYLYVPVECDGSHWRGVRLKFDGRELQSAVLWDSMKPNEKELEKTTAFKNFTKAVRALSPTVTPSLLLTGIQKDGCNCLFYVLQDASSFCKKDNELTRAGKDANALRFASVLRLAERHPAIGAELARHLRVADNGAVGLKEGVKAVSELSDEDEKTLETFLDRFTTKPVTSEEKPSKEKPLLVGDHEWRAKFDARFAEKLQALYNENKNVDLSEDDEKDLVKKARIATMRIFGFFPPVLDEKGLKPMPIKVLLEPDPQQRKPPTKSS